MHPALGICPIRFLNNGPLGIDLFVHDLQLVFIHSEHVLQTGQLAPTGLGHGMRFLELIRARMLIDGVLAVGFGHHGKRFIQTQTQGLNIRCQRLGAFCCLYAQILKFLQVLDYGRRFLFGPDCSV